VVDALPNCIYRSTDASVSERVYRRGEHALRDSLRQTRGIGLPHGRGRRPYFGSGPDTWQCPPLSHMSDREASDRNLPSTDVSASEVANYTFCAKAWHLEHVLGGKPSAMADQRRIAGVEAHARHGAAIRSANQMSTWLVRGLVALLLIAVGVLVLGLVLSGR
jgi:hypothetical protein